MTLHRFQDILCRTRKAFWHEALLVLTEQETLDLHTTPTIQHTSDLLLLAALAPTLLTPEQIDNLPPSPIQHLLSQLRETLQ